jgi:hypothetical protein
VKKRINITSHDNLLNLHLIIKSSSIRFSLSPLLVILLVFLRIAPCHPHVESNHNVYSEYCAQNRPAGDFEWLQVMMLLEIVLNSIEYSEWQCEHQNTEEKQLQQSERCFFGVLWDERTFIRNWWTWRGGRHRSSDQLGFA